MHYVITQKDSDLSYTGISITNFWFSIIESIIHEQLSIFQQIRILAG